MTDRQTDASAVAKTRLALHAVVRKKTTKDKTKKRHSGALRIIHGFNAESFKNYMRIDLCAFEDNTVIENEAPLTIIIQQTSLQSHHPETSAGNTGIRNL